MQGQTGKFAQLLVLCLKQRAAAPQMLRLPQESILQVLRSLQVSLSQAGLLTQSRTASCSPLPAARCSCSSSTSLQSCPAAAYKCPVLLRTCVQTD